MPSTFTGNTGIEKIADGEQTSLWGQTTNLNFDIIDRALNGSVDVVLSGTTHTLTTSDGVLSDGQFAVLVFTGSPSGTNTVTIAPNTAQKLYFVRNTTSQTVVLSQGSGANVSIPAGLSKIVYSNGAGAGAAVFDITNTLSGNVTGNAGTATALQTARTIGGVSFNGTANINLPGVNIAGNQNTTGSAASLTTARTLTIGSTGKTFNGTANVSWSLAEIGVNNSTLTLATSGIATGSQTWTSNQGSNATFTVNVPATNLGYTSAASTGAVTSSTGDNATIPAATTSAAGLLTSADKTKLDGIQAGAQVNVGTNLSITGGTTAGPTINSSTGSNVTFPTASGTASGAVTTGNQTWAGTKTFSAAVVLSTAGTATTHAVRADRTITAGTGLTGGGNLTANRTINAVTLTQAQAENPSSTVFGTVSGQRLAQAVAATGLPAPDYVSEVGPSFPTTLTLTTFTHGLGAIPKQVNLYAVVTAAVGGWAVGYKFPLSVEPYIGTTIIAANSTSIDVGFRLAATLVSKDFNSNLALTGSSSFKLRVEAWK